MTNLRLPGQYDERLFAAAGISGMQGPYYNWNRWYLPSMGRYLELDPVALNGEFNGPYGPNWYGYAEGNPLRHTDRTGLCIEDACVGEAILFGILWDALWTTLDVAVVGAVAVTLAEAPAAPSACEMAKGGKKNLENEFVRAARQLPRHIDPCEWLRLEYQRNPDSETRQKIKLAQKVLGCRRSSGGGP